MSPKGHETLMKLSTAPLGQRANESHIQAACLCLVKRVQTPPPSPPHPTTNGTIRLALQKNVEENPAESVFPSLSMRQHVFSHTLIQLL
ncbi:hypothetical protein AOLI_G00193490 [Acnodon oligacanthus]